MKELQQKTKESRKENWGLRDEIKEAEDKLKALNSKIDSAKSHVAGISSHDGLVNPTDVSVAYPNMKSNIKTYVEYIHKHVLKGRDKQTLIDILVKAVRINHTNYTPLPKGVADKEADVADKEANVSVVPKHLFMALVSNVMFLNFENVLLRSRDDTCTMSRDAAIEKYSKMYLYTSKEDHGGIWKEYAEYRSWYTDMVKRFEVALAPILNNAALGFSLNDFIGVGTDARVAFDHLAKSVFGFNCLLYGKYPRGDLIIRQPGSTHTSLCMSHYRFYERVDPEDDVRGDVVAVMLIPGIQFEKTNFEAVVIFANTKNSAF